MASVRSPKRLLFSKLNKVSSLNLSCRRGASSPLITLVASSGPTPTAAHQSYAEGSKPGCSTGGKVSWGQRREGQSSPTPGWPLLFRCSPGYSWLSGLQVQCWLISALHSPGPPCPSSLGWSPWDILPVCTPIWECSDPSATPCICPCWTSLGSHRPIF